MNEEHEALKLALEALQNINSADNDRDFLGPEECCDLDDAITAIEEALAHAPEVREPPCKTGSQCTNKCPQCDEPAQHDMPKIGCVNHDCDKCKAQQQEPVAWMWRCKPYCDWPDWSVSLKRPADSGRDGHKRTEGYEDIPLYTSPQPSKPLTLWTEAQHERAYRNSPELRKDVKSLAAFKRVAKKIAAMYGIKGDA